MGKQEQLILVSDLDEATGKVVDAHYVDFATFQDNMSNYSARKLIDSYTWAADSRREIPDVIIRIIKTEIIRRMEAGHSLPLPQLVRSGPFEWTHQKER